MSNRHPTQICRTSCTTVELIFHSSTFPVDLHVSYIRVFEQRSRRIEAWSSQDRRIKFTCEPYMKGFNTTSEARDRLSRQKDDLILRRISRTRGKNTEISGSITSNTIACPAHPCGSNPDGIRCFANDTFGRSAFEDRIQALRRKRKHERK